MSGVPRFNSPFARALFRLAHRIEGRARRKAAAKMRPIPPGTYGIEVQEATASCGCPWAGPERAGLVEHQTGCPYYGASS